MKKNEYYHDTLCGLSNVYVKGVSEWTDVKGNKGITIPNFQSYMRALLKKVLTKNGLLNGEEIRFLRTTYGKTQESLAEIFGITSRTVQRWESDETKIDASSDLRLRLLTAQYEFNQEIPNELIAIFVETLQPKTEMYYLDVDEVA